MTGRMTFVRFAWAGCALVVLVLLGSSGPARARIACPTGQLTNSTPPVVSGTGQVGGTLTSTQGTWNSCASQITGYTYQWFRDGSAVPGKTSSAYGVGAADGGHSLSAQVTATNDFGSAATAGSNSVAIPAPPAAAQCADGIDNDGDGKVDYPADPGCSGTSDNDERDAAPAPGTPPSNTSLNLSGNMEVGETVGAVGTWSGDQPMTITYQWRRCGYSAQVESSSPVLYERFGERSGTVAHDTTDMINNAQLPSGGVSWGSPSLLTGDPNPAVALDGVAGSLTVPAAASLDSGDNFTLEAIIRLPSLGRRATIFSKGSGGYLLRIGADNRLYLSKSGAGDIAVSSSTVLASHRLHIAATKNGPTVRLYVNGHNVTGTVTNQTIVNTSYALQIGRSYDVATAKGSDYLLGTMDEVAIWDHALGLDAIQAQYTWMNDACTAISGATRSTYTTTLADAGFSLQVSATATNGYGSASASSPIGLPVLEIVDDAYEGDSSIMNGMTAPEFAAATGGTYVKAVDTSADANAPTGSDSRCLSATHRRRARALGITWRVIWNHTYWCFKLVSGDPYGVLTRVTGSVEARARDPYFVVDEGWAKRFVDDKGHKAETDAWARFEGQAPTYRSSMMSHSYMCVWYGGYDYKRCADSSGGPP